MPHPLPRLQPLHSRRGEEQSSVSHWTGSKCGASTQEDQSECLDGTCHVRMECVMRGGNVWCEEVSVCTEGVL